MLERAEILARLPHRPPFLFVDRAEVLEPGTSATGMTTFAADNPVFAGHFPGAPIVPGVILVECVAQVAAIMLSSAGDADDSAGARYAGKVLAKVESAVFTAPVGPGDTICSDVRLVRRLGDFVKVEGRIRIDDRPVMRATLVLCDTASSRAGGEDGGDAG